MPTSASGAKREPTKKKSNWRESLRNAIKKREDIGGKPTAPRSERPSYLGGKKKKKRYTDALDEAGDIGRKKKKS